MNHRTLAATLALAAGCAAMPAFAAERSNDESFHDRLREIAEERLSFTWNRSNDEDWLDRLGPRVQRDDWEAAWRRIEERFENRGRDHDKPGHGWGGWAGWGSWGGWHGGHGDHGGGSGHGWHGKPWLDPHCVTPVPEPASAALMAGGLLALGWVRRRRR